MALLNMLNRNITALEFGSNFIGESEEAAILDALRNNPRIVVLDLGYGRKENLDVILRRNRRIAGRAQLASQEAFTVLLCVN